MTPAGVPTFAALFGAEEFPRASYPPTGEAFASARKLFVRDVLGPDGLNVLNVTGLAQVEADQLVLRDAFGKGCGFSDWFNSSLSGNDQLQELDDQINDWQRSLVGPPRMRRLVVYYTGHGGTTEDGRYYLAVKASRQENYSRHSIMFDQLAKSLKRLKPPYQCFLVIDACYAGKGVALLLQSQDGEPIKEAIQAEVESELHGRGVCLLCSSPADKPSYLLPDKSSTSFMAALSAAVRKGKEGGEPLLSVQDLAELMWGELKGIKQAVEEYNEQQTNPALRQEFDAVPPQVHWPKQEPGTNLTTEGLIPNRWRPLDGRSSARVQKYRIEELLKYLGSRDADERLFAIRTLRKMGPAAEPAVPALAAALKDGHALVREAAGDALGHLGRRAKAAIPSLTAAVAHDDAQMRWVAAVALAKIGPAAVRALVAALKGDDARVRRAAACALSQSPEVAAVTVVPALAAALEDDKAGVRVAAADALRDIGHAAAAAVPALAAALKDDDALVRRAAAGALRKIGRAAEAAVPALAAALEDDVADVRWEAASALGGLGPRAEAAIPALVAALQDDVVEVRHLALSALGRIGPAAIPILISEFKNVDPVVRSNAAAVLRRIGPAAMAAVPALIAVLEDPDADVRESAAGALDRIAPGSAPTI